MFLNRKMAVPEPAHRVFFAILPPAPEARWIGTVRDALHPRSSLVSDWRLHMTALISNDYRERPDEMIERAKRAADDLQARMFRVVFDRVMSGANGALLVPSGPIFALQLFQRQLERHLAMAGFDRRHGWRFSPHFTLFYGEGRPVDQFIDPVSWQVGEFVLIHSLVGLTQHHILGRWSLTA